MHAWLPLLLRGSHYSLSLLIPLSIWLFSFTYRKTQPRWLSLSLANPSTSTLMWLPLQDPLNVVALCGRTISTNPTPSLESPSRIKGDALKFLWAAITVNQAALILISTTELPSNVRSTIISGHPHDRPSCFRFDLVVDIFLCHWSNGQSHTTSKKRVCLKWYRISISNQQTNICRDFYVEIQNGKNHEKERKDYYLFLCVTRGFS